MKKLDAHQINIIREWISTSDLQDMQTHEILKEFENHFPLASEKETDAYFLNQANNKLLDIHQWSNLLLSNGKLTERVTREIIGSINNRCTD